MENKNCCGLIPQFNNLEELNNWATRQFGLDSENPINEVLEDYLSVKEFLYGVHDLLDRNRKPLNTEGGFMVPIRPAKGEATLDVFKVDVSEDFKISLGNGLDGKLRVKIVRWDRGPFLVIDVEAGLPVLYVPVNIYCHELRGLIKKAAAKLTAYQEGREA